MKLKPIALAISLTMLLAAAAGCTHMGQTTATTSPRTGVIGVLDREAEQIRAYFNRKKGESAHNTGTTRPSNEALRSDADDLSARHLTALIGLADRDVRNTLGDTYVNGALAGHYNHTVYGADTDLYVQYNDNNTVNKVIITVDKNDAVRWRRELNALYGIQGDESTVGTSQWLDKNAHISWAQTGDKVRITITGKTL